MVKRKNNKSHKKQKFLSLTQKIILGIISFLLVLIFIISLCAFLFTNENIIKGKISALAAKYYETYIYENLKNSSQVPNFEEAIERYKDYGFAHIYLRQLIYYDNDQETIDYLKKHCDENKTSVKIFPEPPYSKTSYRAEYIYSCDFE